MSFRHFRKHSKAFMAIAAVLCMFLFVFASAFDTGRSRGSDPRDSNSLVATWNGGALTQGKLSQLYSQRKIVDQFLRTLIVASGAQPGDPLPRTVPNLLLQSDNPEYVEREIIATEVIADLAAESGMSVSNNLINYYIKELGQKKVSPEEIKSILRNLGEGNAAHNEVIVFAALRDMLLSHFYQSGYIDASLVVLPEQRWDDWRRVNERISLQAVELPVESFLDQVPKPTDAQLREIYEEFKDTDPNLFYDVDGQEIPSPNPGFAEPRRVTLQYLLGSVTERTEKLKPSITDKEIEEYYERNKRLDFRKMPPLLGFGDEADGSAADVPAGETPATETPAPPASGEATPAPTTETPGESPAPVDAAPENPTPSASENGATAPAEAGLPPAESQPSAEPAPPAGESPAPAGEQPAADGGDGASSSTRRPSPFRLASYQEQPADDSAPPAETATEADAPTEPAASAPATEAATDSSAPAEPPADSSPAETATPDAAPAAADSASAPASAEAAAPAAEEDYEPLEKVRDEIRERLARDKAVQELEQSVSEAASELQSEFNKYGIAVIEAKEAEAAAPKPPKSLTDLGPLAERYSLAYENKMAPLTRRELSETAVGRARDASTFRTIVTLAAFDSLELYEPMVAKEPEGDWYVVMKIADAPKRVPEFSEIRDRVVAAWQRREAGKLAEKKAEELAEAAEKSEQPFDQFFADKGYKIVPRTEFFSWISYPADSIGQGVPPQLTKVADLKNVAHDFMRAAFALEGNKTASAMNFDKSAAYVIRLDRKQYPDDELRKLFLEDVNSWPGNMDMLRMHAARFNDTVRRDLESRAGLEIDEAWRTRRQAEAQQRN